MPTFGDKLRHEREARNARIRDVAERTQIGLRYLEALERNDFDALPGPCGFGKLYIRAYAETLGFDPRPLIDAFEQERNKRLKAHVDRPAREPRPRRRLHYVPPPRKPAATSPAGPATPETVAAITPAPPPEAAPLAETEAAVVTEAPVQEVSVQTEAMERETGTEQVAVDAAEAPAPVVVETEAATAPPNPVRRWVIAATLTAVALLIVAGVTLRPASNVRSSEGATTQKTEAQPETVSTTPQTAAIAGAEAPPPKPSAEPTATPVRPAPEPPTVVTAPGLLTVTESGVGTSIVDRRLLGQGTRFDEGSTVFFFTRVVGGAPGQKLRHVWLHEGRVIQSIQLPLGSAHWRTYSNKTLWGAGNWTVEARGADGQVLARTDFNCVAP